MCKVSLPSRVQQDQYSAYPEGLGKVLVPAFDVLITGMAVGQGWILPDIRKKRKLLFSL